MKPESFQYLQQFEEVFEIAYRSGYVRNIPVRKLKRLISIYEEIIGGKSGYNAYNMCRSGGSCLTSFILELRVELLNQKDNTEQIPAEMTKPLKRAKKVVEKEAEQKPVEDANQERQTDEV